MIITVTPNPAMDEGYTVPELRPGRWFRAKGVHRSPGGRGINVSIVLKQLGYDSVATGFLAGFSGSYIRDNMLERGISTNFVNIKGENRTNTFIFDEGGAVETAVTDIGPTVFPDATRRLFWNIDRLLPRATAVLMGGSLPPGVDENFYKDVIDRVKRKNIPVFVDAFGPSLELAITAMPTVVKIDHRFMESVHGIPLTTLDNLMDVSKRIFDEGVDWVITSYFNNGCVFCTPKGFYMAEINIDQLLTLRSAGDSLMAGMIVAREERLGIEDTIRFAMACVQANVRSYNKGVPSREAVNNAMDEIKIQKLER